MNYKFSNFTGRLSAPSPLDTPTKFGMGPESPALQYMEGTTIPVTDRSVRGKKYAPVPEALQAKMRLFQFPNGLPVHIKGGPVDKILYAFTAAVCFVGFVESCRVYYVLSYPPKAKQE
ncbi:cytochrome c oxidase subunit 7A2, mitochondrial [Procambarus clarkii]|uniref:cytochrome c oxidase subunit 7A2, mitochondrial n=1 Tax=Procambarus clarkii TaxID=6728 RepID=UPI003743F3FE